MSGAAPDHGAAPATGDRGRPPEAAGQESYYGRAIIKAPPWTDEIAWYLVTGGLAGASASLGLAARLAGNDRLARDAMATAAAGVAVSVPLLVDDLGRPARFHHMLRVFKPTSPMSMGSWLFALVGPAAVGAAVAERLGVVPGLRRAAEVVAGGLGPALATYTGALLADTAVPAWHEAGRELPMVFAGGSAASAGGVAVLLTPPEQAGPARRLAVGGAVAELAAAEVMRRRLGETAAPYGSGAAGRLSRLAAACTGAGALLLGLRGRRRAAAAAGGALLLAGSVCQRFAVWKAGVASAADPGQTARVQRERIARSGRHTAVVRH